MQASIAEREQFRSLSAAKLRKVESKTKEFMLFFCRDGVSSPSSPLGETERGTLPHIIFPLGGMRGAPFFCFCFHKIGSEGATALVTRLAGRLRTSRIVANGV